MPRIWIALFVLASTSIAFSEEAARMEQRLARSARFLSSDELGGRGLGSPGIQQAAQFISNRFQQMGLHTRLFDGTPFQKFSVTIGSDLGKENRLRFTSSQGDRYELEIGKGFQPLAIGGDGAFDFPLAFVGYGISALESNYDDYAEIEVKNHAVIILRHEPQQGNPHSLFNGTDHSKHAPFRKKISNAYQHGVAAVLFCTDEHEILVRQKQLEKRIAAGKQELAQLSADLKNNPVASANLHQKRLDKIKRLEKKVTKFIEQAEAAPDAVLGFNDAGSGGETRDIPVLHCSRSAIDQMLAKAGRPNLATLEKKIDEKLVPQSFVLPDWRATGEVDITRKEVEVQNVVAVLEGEGPLANETVVVGAHYDHLGRGGEGSAKPGSDEIHNGADDNASGTAALLEVAHLLKSRSKPLARRVVLIAFTGEERGLLGSAEYVRTPPYPLDQTVTMINFDMVGRLQNNKLILNGTSTAEEFDPWIDELNERHGFELTKSPGGYGPSDHATFYAKKIPVLHFFTGSHTDYHRPSDDFELLNVEGMRRVSQFVADLTARVANAAERPTYVEVEQPALANRSADPRPYFGSIPDFGSVGGGYAISGVASGSPAAEGGLKGGDKIVRLGEFKIGNLEDFDGALRKFEAGDRVDVVVDRDGREVTLPVTLDPPK